MQSSEKITGMIFQLSMGGFHIKTAENMQETTLNSAAFI